MILSNSVLVVGCGDVGSAVAHRLHQLGVRVVLHDRPAPAHIRRGMSFTDALFHGSASLEGVVAQHADTVEDATELLVASGCIPVCTVDLQSLVNGLQPVAIIDAQMRKRVLPENRPAFAGEVIGVGPGFTVGANCTVAIESAWGVDLGKVVRDGAPSALAGEPRLLDGVGRQRFVYAPSPGTWSTRRSIGDQVRVDEVIGVLDGRIRAPIAGTLRDLTHDGVTVDEHQKLIEVDPRAKANVFGLGERPMAIARGVSKVLRVDRSGVSIRSMP